MPATMKELRKIARESAKNNPFADSLNSDYRPREFNLEVYHAMQERDDQLAAESVVHGSLSKEFVYKFPIKGTTVTGISIIGARHLASQYKGIRSRIVASTEKTGSMFLFRSFDPMNIEIQHIEELEKEDDFFEVILEITDLKTGNSLHVRKKELKQERKADGSRYTRPHYDVIAESKAFRNGVISIIPQDVVVEFERRCIELGQFSTTKTLQQRRDELQAYCIKNGLDIDRHKLNALVTADLDGIDRNSANFDALAKSLTSAGVLKSSRMEITDLKTGDSLQVNKLTSAGVLKSSRDDLASQILSATSKEQLDELAELAKGLQGAEREDSRKAYANALKRLGLSKKKTNNEPPTESVYDRLMRMVAEAVSMEDLDTVADAAQAHTDAGDITADEQAEVNAIAMRRAVELDKDQATEDMF